MQKHWYQKQLRMLQTVLREIDIINYDAKGVVDYMKKSNSNTLIVNAGGIIDFWHNDDGFSHWNPFMKDGQEILTDICSECHKSGFHVITRIDFRGAQKYRYDVHPDWFAANPDGTPHIRGNEALYMPCYLSEYANGHAVRFLKNLMTKFPIDGIWENAVGFGMGACYCRNCRETYMAELGKEIPVDPDFMSPIFNEYRAWKAQKADEHIVRIRDTVKSFGDDKAYSAEVFGIYHSSIYSGIDVFAAKYFDYIVGVSFLTGQSKIWDDFSYSATSVRFLKALDPQKTTVLLVGNNGTRWRLVKDPSQDIRTWMWEAVSVGSNFWNCHFNGQYPAATNDKRNAYIETDVYTYLKDNEDLIQGQIPVTDVGIFYSSPSRDKAHLDKDESYANAIKGLEVALVDNHIPYGFVTDKDLSLEKLPSYGILCLPNTMCLSDSQIEIIKKFVENGGSLMASYKTSLFDEKGKKRPDFGLKDVFGLSYTGIEKDTSFDCYQMVRMASHKITEGMDADKTIYFINGGNTLLATTIDKDGEIVCSYVPIIPNQYPEQAWIRMTETQFPTVFTHKYGKGKVVYFPNQMDALLYTNGHTDYFALVTNTLKYLRKSNWTLETNAPDSIHAGLTKDLGGAGSYILSFVNITSSGRRAIRHLIDTREFNATLRLPVKALASTKTIFPSPAGEIKVLGSKTEDAFLVINLQIPSFKEFISLAIEVN